jgi:hypothetical protein
MTRQTQFKKLKEKIEAAKLGLTEKSDTEIDDGSKHGFSSSNSPETVKQKQVKIKPGDLPSSGSIFTGVVDMIPKTGLGNTEIADHTLGSSASALADEFQFFHRERRPKSSGDFSSGVSLQEANKIESEAFLFERLGHRLAILEGDVEQNRKYIHELINLFSKLDLREKPVNRKLKTSQRLNRRHMFWLLIGFLAIGWFGLTPSGHIAVKHFLTFMQKLSTIYNFI